jgi:hypothetical protein
MQWIATMNDKPDTKTDRIARGFLDHPVYAWVIVVAVALAGLGQAVGGWTSMAALFKTEGGVSGSPTPQPKAPDEPRPSSVAMPVVQSVTLSAPESVIEGASFAAVLTGNYADGTSAPLTNGVSWEASDQEVLTVVASGQGMGKREGTVLVIGQFEGKSASQRVEVVSAGLWDPADEKSSYGETNRMHMCPKGTGIARVKGGKGNHNQFYCARLTTNASAVTDVESTGARSVNGSHACPANHYLRGMNIGENRFTCSTHLGSALSPLDSDITSQQYGNVLSCRPGEIAVGFNENEERLLCLPVKAPAAPI